VSQPKKDHLLEELRAQILIAPHPDLEPHLLRGALIMLADELDLAVTAAQIARNDQGAISILIEAGKLTRPDPKDLDVWRAEKAFFRFVIVQPFVLAQRFRPEEVTAEA
jgi:hypothetical protein